LNRTKIQNNKKIRHKLPDSLYFLFIVKAFQQNIRREISFKYEEKKNKNLTKVCKNLYLKN